MHARAEGVVGDDQGDVCDEEAVSTHLARYEGVREGVRVAGGDIAAATGAGTLIRHDRGAKTNNTGHVVAIVVRVDTLGTKWRHGWGGRQRRRLRGTHSAAG